MSTQTNQAPESNHSARNGAVAGVALIALGLLALGGQLIEGPMLGLLFLPALAAIFLAWGLITRTFGLIIPGGILAGIGLGAILIESSLFTISDTAEGGMFLVAFAAGWVLISALSVFTDERFQWWPLIPAGIMAMIGAFLFIGDAGLKVLELLGLLWPVALIVLGLGILYKRVVKA